MEGLDDVKKELETKRQALLQELDSAMGKVASLEKDMKRVDDAIRALTKGKTKKTRKKTTEPKTPTPAEPFLGTTTSGTTHSTGLTGGTGFDPFAE